MIDLQELEQALREMQPHQKIYKVVKAALKEQGHWKNKKRGKPNLNLNK
jgi:hypothetical protein